MALVQAQALPRVIRSQNRRNQKAEICFFLSGEFLGDGDHLACMQVQSCLIVDVAQLQVCILMLKREQRRGEQSILLHIDAQRESEKSKVHCCILMLKSKAKHIVAY